MYYLCFIYEPGKKLYFVGDNLWSLDVVKAMIFEEREKANAKAQYWKLKADIDVSIEKIEV